MQSIFDPAKTKSVFKLATTKNFHSFLYIVGPWHSQVWFSHWSANLWFQITAILSIFSSFSNTSQLTVRTTFSEHLHSVGVLGFLLLWLRPHPGLRPQWDSTYNEDPFQITWDTLPPAPQLHLTSSQEHKDSLRQEVAFQNMPKRWKKDTFSYILFVSSTDEDSLTVISSDTCEPGENIKDGLSSQRDPLPDTNLLSVCLWELLFFFLPKEEVF